MSYAHPMVWLRHNAFHDTACTRLTGIWAHPLAASTPSTTHLPPPTLPTLPRLPHRHCRRLGCPAPSLCTCSPFFTLPYLPHLRALRTAGAHSSPPPFETTTWHGQDAAHATSALPTMPPRAACCRRLPPAHAGPGDRTTFPLCSSGAAFIGGCPPWRRLHSQHTGAAPLPPRAETSSRSLFSACAYKTANSRHSDHLGVLGTRPRHVASGGGRA